MAYNDNLDIDVFAHRQPDGTFKHFKRSGECNRCGQCCEGDPFDGRLGEPKIENMCPLYDLLDGKGHCTDRMHPYYLSGCNIWPTHPEQIANKPLCGYSFEEVDASINT